MLAFENSDPRVIQGVLTLLAALIAAVAALVVAFVAYPWQKDKDRKNQIREEQREIYRRYVTKFNRVRTSNVLKKDDRHDSFLELGEILAEIAVTSNDDVLKKATAARAALAGFVLANFETAAKGAEGKDEKEKTVKALDEAYADLIAFMRNEIVGNTSLTKSVVQAYLRSIPTVSASIHIGQR